MNHRVTEGSQNRQNGVNCKAQRGVNSVIVVGGRQTWPDVTLTMILSDT